MDRSGFGVVEIVVAVALLIGLVALTYMVLNQGEQANDETEVEESAVVEDDNMSRFNTTVENDINRILVEINTYAANNNGRYPLEPGEIQAFEETYLTVLGDHPVSDLPYTIDETKFETHEYITYRQGVCGDEGFVLEAESSRQIALTKELPGGQMYCIDNS